jgi:hypothetical protein
VEPIPFQFDPSSSLKLPFVIVFDSSLSVKNLHLNCEVSDSMMKIPRRISENCFEFVVMDRELSLFTVELVKTGANL